jgi:hypothetical protein
MNKQLKNTIRKYLRIVDSVDYKEFQKRDFEEFEKSRNDFAKTHDDDLKRDDYYLDDDVCLAMAYFYEVVSNDDVNKLRIKLSKLPKRDFRVENYYKKPTFFKRRAPPQHRQPPHPRLVLPDGANHLESEEEGLPVPERQDRRLPLRLAQGHVIRAFPLPRRRV